MKIEVEEIRKFVVGPRDTLVVKVNGILTQDQAERIRAAFRRELDCRVLVADGSVELLIVSDQAA